MQKSGNGEMWGNGGKGEKREKEKTGERVKGSRKRGSNRRGVRDSFIDMHVARVPL